MRSLERRLCRLEVKIKGRLNPPSSRVVLVPWDEWHSGDHDAMLARQSAMHPEGRMFMPCQAPSCDAWERMARDQQAALKAGSVEGNHEGH